MDKERVREVYEDSVSDGEFAGVQNVISRIIERYGEQALKRSACRNPVDLEFFEKVMWEGKFGSIVEIGTFRGISAAFMSQYAGTIHTFDVSSGYLPGAETFDVDGMFREMGIGNIVRHVVANDEEKRVVIDSMEFDFAFIDGDHGKGAIVDFCLVEKCGTVLFHDYDRMSPFVYALVNQLPETEVIKFGNFALWTDRKHNDLQTRIRAKL